MSKMIVGALAVIVCVSAVGCAQPRAGEGAAASPLAPSADSATTQASAGGTVKESLSGAGLNGVVPQGQASVDQSRFASGGDSVLTVQLKSVNLPDGTVLGVTLDFTPMGSITLSHGGGSLTTSLGHFAVSRDQVRVNNGGHHHPRRRAFPVRTAPNHSHRLPRQHRGRAA